MKMAKKIQLDLDRISEERFRYRVERLESGRPLMFKETRERDPVKRKLLLDFNLRTTPAAKDILSGKAFRQLMGTKRKPGPKRGTRTAKEPKDRIIPLRVSESQYNRLIEKARNLGLTVSDMLRANMD
jgi:hypothetical protein